MARIVLLLTRTPWRDFRLYDLEGPALLAAGHEVIYASGGPPGQTEHPFTWVILGERERWLARRLGGVNLYRRIAALSPDVVQLCSLEQLPLGLLLKLLGCCRVVYDCREDMASALYERRKALPKVIRRGIFLCVRFLEAIAALQFDGIITADPGVYELFSNIPDERKLVFYNAALLTQFLPDYPISEDRNYDIVVLGSMSSVRSGTQMVLDAVGLLRRQGFLVRLLLVGQPEGEMVNVISERIARYGLRDYVHCTGLLPHSAVPAVLAEARIGIVPLLDYPKFHRNIACKAFEYMACGMPTIASDLPPQRLFLNNDFAILFPPGNVIALTEAIRSLLTDHQRLERMGRLARLAVEENWNGEKEQEKLKKFYAVLMQLRPRGRGPRSQ